MLLFITVTRLTQVAYGLHHFRRLTCNNIIIVMECSIRMYQVNTSIVYIINKCFQLLCRCTFDFRFLCLGEEWLEIYTFAKQSKLKVLFDLNVLLRKNSNWDWSNAEQLLDFSAENRMDLDWQLGNGN